MELGVSGLASGFDWRTFVDQMADVQRAPQQRLLAEQRTIQLKRNAYNSVKTQLAALQTRVKALQEAALFDGRGVSSSDEKTATASAGSGTALGRYSFNITQLATAAKLNGTGNIGSPLSSSSDVSGVMLDSSAFPKAVTAGTFTVNGAQVTVAATDSLQDVFSAIQTATGGNVSAEYDPSGDTVTLTATSGQLVLGSSTDTSNFLSVTRLYNNGTGSVSSAGALGGVNRFVPLSASNLALPVHDGGAGLFKVNGVEITYNAATDSLESVLRRISDSAAGVSASYDSVQDRVVLSNKDTGDTGISIQDVTGNFVSAAGLATGALARGQNLLYTLNGGGLLVSTSNTIAEDSSGIAGLAVTAQSTGTVEISVGSDTAKIKAAINDFLAEYNKVQSVIDTNTASSTDANGKVTAGILADESAASAVASRLRSTAYAIAGGLAASMNQLADLGIVTNGTDNSLKLENDAALDAALSASLADVKKLFTDSAGGIAVKLNTYLEGVIGENGSLADKDSRLTKDIASIDTQIADLEKQVQADRQSLIDRFVRMETIQAQINQQMQFLLQRLGTTSSAK